MLIFPPFFSISCSLSHHVFCGKTSPPPPLPPSQCYPFLFFSLIGVDPDRIIKGLYLHSAAAY